MKITVKAKILFNCKVAINLKKSDLNETNNLVNIKDVAFGFLSQFWEIVNMEARGRCKQVFEENKDRKEKDENKNNEQYF